MVNENSNNIDSIICKGIKVLSVPLHADYLVYNLCSDMFDTRYNKACNLEIVYLDTLANLLSLSYCFITITVHFK